MVEQFEQALGNLLTALRAAGGEPEHLTSLTIYATDLRDYRAHGREIGAVWRKLAGPRYPAMAAVGVSQLWDAAARRGSPGLRRHRRSGRSGACTPLTSGT